MHFFKILDGVYVDAIGYSNVGIEISEDEFVLLRNLMANPPMKEGKFYRLRDDNHEWDEFDENGGN